MPLDKLIDLLAEAAVRKLSQKREAGTATPDDGLSSYPWMLTGSRFFRRHRFHLIKTASRLLPIH